ncbi:head GIN domain-containing protein [Chitinophaga nivalis]|uniref:DUF2807 domain-containing protein n=1 Tax=Chitinophaga nivalis TaxID=2991709 RepID=A0ABT3IPZ9_9BACT|nr:head GIN domain-containing protein [Chitinophaga nivalis]MCW3464333.1 DUF2807 domain-containing protein [Chitinophaga nivalis]MCW3485976.1 DUF2807 domain-containing protein [Chitinophaga nivalis]
MKKLSRYILVAIPFLLVAGILSAFTISWTETIRGNGKVSQEDRTAGSFKEISTSGVFKVVIQQGSTHSIKIEAEENLLPYIETSVSGNELSIHTKRGHNINPTKSVTVYVTMAKVNKLSASGASGFTSTGILKTDRLKLAFSGAADATLDIEAANLEVGLSGASNIKLKGSSSDAEYHISGTADIAALDLESQDVAVSISGTGKAQVFAQKKLEVNISGLGKVKYKGEPTVRQEISGMGKISKI